MKYGVYNIYDKVGDMFSHPLIFKNDVIAERSFDNTILSINDPTKQPEDFELNKIGFYDDETGKIESCAVKLMKKGSQTLLERYDKDNNYVGNGQQHKLNHVVDEVK